MDPLNGTEKFLIVIDNLYGETSVYCSDPQRAMVVVIQGDESDPEACVEATAGIDQLPDELKQPVVDVLEAEMGPEPADPAKMETPAPPLPS